MKHLKLFNDTVSYEAYKNGSDYVLPNVSYIEETKGVSYDPYVDLTANYLTIEALEDNLTVVLKKNKTTIYNYEYCVDGDGNWKKVTYNNPVESINTGHTLSFRGELIPENRYSYGYGIGAFTVNKNFNLKGNCMSMLFGDNAADNYSLEGKDYAFYDLFCNCTTLKSVSANFLPATTLASNCYLYMFYGCTSLTIAPDLPATALTDDCYGGMFHGCTSLTTAPELSATALTIRCYEDMFYDCTSLTTAPTILPATTLAAGCYQNMFNGCSSLTTAPELPATKLAESCYYYMFENCSKLNYIKMLATDISAILCLTYWINGVASTGTFVKNSAMANLPTATESNDYAGIPRGWTVQNA